MKVAIYPHDYDYGEGPLFRNMDFRNPQLGNPGIGGTQYEFILLAYALVNFSDCEVNIYCHEDSNIYPDGVKVHIFRDNSDLIQQIKNDSNDIFVIRAEIRPEFFDMFERAEKAGINTVAWSHNFMPYYIADSLVKNQAVKRVVMVSHEHYDYHLDHPVNAKSTYIYNMFYGRHFRLRDSSYESAVTFTGGLYRFKGFHVLASMWKDILKEVPGAKLYVIGSGKLYNKSSALGVYGLADPEYEAEFMKHLTDKGGKIIPSVKFLGNMGAEKAEIYYKTAVGVMNPTGTDETFGISALDAEACGVPVVTRAINGLLETVRHGETGFLGRNPEEIKKYIILLLKDKELNIRLGRKAKEFAEKSFLPEAIVKQWLKLFDDVLNNRPCEYIPPTPHNTGHKRLKIFNRWLRLHHIPTISVSTLQDAMCLFTYKRLAKNMMPGFYEWLKKLMGR